MTALLTKKWCGYHLQLIFVTEADQTFTLFQNFGCHEGMMFSMLATLSVLHSRTKSTRLVKLGLERKLLKISFKRLLRELKSVVILV
ncbi:hypothetical protein QQP08_002464 [Theobroma cacao]|nr:hypothetical protein QQP08_002464 [Theobroma cacao]